MLSQAQKAKIKTIKQEYERNGFKEIHGNDGVWRPRTTGEVLEGVYLRVEPNADNWNRNKYFFDDQGKTLDLDGQPIALNGEVAVYGSVVFDDKMKKIRTGVNVAIIYCGEQANPGKKNATKLFTIMGKTNPDQVKDSSPMKQRDYPEARELIRDCRTFLGSEGKHNPTPTDIVKYAEKLINDSDDPNHKLLQEVKIIMAEDEKARKEQDVKK